MTNQPCQMQCCVEQFDPGMNVQQILTKLTKFCRTLHRKGYKGLFGTGRWEGPRGDVGSCRGEGGPFSQEKRIGPNACFPIVRNLQIAIGFCK